MNDCVITAHYVFQGAQQCIIIGMHSSVVRKAPQ